MNPLIDAIDAISALPLAARIEAYNAATRALARVVGVTDPACAPQLIAPSEIDANDYNPNRVAAPEMALLEDSIRADGVTMPVVVVRSGARWTVVDGFHRRSVTAAMGYAYIPCSVIDRPTADRMASTVRHNRARGKHQIDLMASLVRGMMALGWVDGQIAQHLGMSEEELLRLRQIAGAAQMLAAQEHSQSWEVISPLAEPKARPPRKSAKKAT